MSQAVGLKQVTRPPPSPSPPSSLHPPLPPKPPPTFAVQVLQLCRSLQLPQPVLEYAQRAMFCFSQQESDTFEGLSLASAATLCACQALSVSVDVNTLLLSSQVENHQCGALLPPNPHALAAFTRLLQVLLNSGLCAGHAAAAPRPARPRSSEGPCSHLQCNSSASDQEQNAGAGCRFEREEPGVEEPSATEEPGAARLPSRAQPQHRRQPFSFAGQCTHLCFIGHSPRLWSTDRRRLMRFSCARRQGAAL